MTSSCEIKRVYRSHCYPLPRHFMTCSLMSVNLISATGHNHVYMCMVRVTSPEGHGVSNHRRLGYSSNNIVRLTSKEISKLRISGLSDGNLPTAVGFLPPRACNMEYVPNVMTSSFYLTFRRFIFDNLPSTSGNIKSICILIIEALTRLPWKVMYTLVILLLSNCVLVVPYSVSDFGQLLRAELFWNCKKEGACIFFHISIFRWHNYEKHVLWDDKDPFMLHNQFRGSFWPGMMTSWKHFPRSWPFVRGIHRLPVNSHHKGQKRGGLIFLYAHWINGWVNNREAGDLRSHRTHYDVIMALCVARVQVAMLLA